MTPLQAHLAASGWHPAAVELFDGRQLTSGAVAAACRHSPGMVADLAVSVGSYFEGVARLGGAPYGGRLPDDLTDLALNLTEQQ